MPENDNAVINTRHELNAILQAGVVPKIIWCFWYDGPMNVNRTRSIELMKAHLNIPICLVTKKNLHEFILPEYPLHPAFDYLSDVHKSDYLRIYLLHHYGGGWHDIKPTMVSYELVWNEFTDPEVYFVGKPEIKGGPAKVHDSNGLWMPRFWRELVATNRWVGRPNTPLTQEMFREVNLLFDQHLDQLKKNPAKHPYDKKRNWIKRLLRFETNNYPLEWTVFGNIFHPLNYKYQQHIKRSLPSDTTENLGFPHR